MAKLIAVQANYAILEARRELGFEADDNFKNLYFAEITPLNDAVGRQLDAFINNVNKEI